MKKIITLVFLALLTTLMFGCKQVRNNWEEEKDLIVGLECDYAPFNWTESNYGDDFVKISGTNHYAYGYDIEVAKIIAETLGKKLVIKKLAWEGLIPALNSSTIDLVIAGMTATPERKENVNFTNPYYESKVVLVMRSDSQYANKTELADFANAKTVSQIGTLYTEYTKEYFSNPTLLDNYPSMYNYVNTKMADFFLAEEPVAREMFGQNENLLFKPSSEINGLNLPRVPVNIGVRKDRTDTLLTRVNQILESINKDQIMKSILTFRLLKK